MATDISHRLYYRKNNTTYSIPSLTVAPSNGLGVGVAGVTRYFEATKSSKTNTVAFMINNSTYYLKNDVVYINLVADAWLPSPYASNRQARLKTVQVYNTQNGFSSNITITAQRRGGSIVSPTYSDLGQTTLQAGTTSTTVNMPFETWSASTYFRFKITIGSYTFYSSAMTISDSGTTTYRVDIN